MINSRIISFFQQSTRILLPGILFLYIFTVSCKNDPKEIAALTNKSQAQEDKMEDGTILYSKNGKVTIRVFAHILIDNEAAKPPYIDMKNGLRVDFYDDSTNIKTTLTARYARYYPSKENILIRDSVVVTNKKGERLNTEELIWSQTNQKIFTEKPVKITTPNQVLFGDGLEANQEFTWYRIKNFKGTMQVNKSEVP